MKRVIHLLLIWSVLTGTANLRAADTTNLPDLHALSLSDAVRLLERNHDVRLTAIAVNSAAAASIAAGADPNPALTVQTANINRAQGIGSGGLRDKTVDTTLRIDQLIERGGKRDLRVKTAHNLELAVGEDLADMRRQLRQTVADAYYDLLAAQERETSTAHIASLFDETLRVAERRVQFGDLADADAARIRIDALRARNDARQSIADRKHAQQALALLLALETDWQNLHVTDPWPIPQADNGADFSTRIESVLAQRPDVRAAQARLEAAIAARDLAVAQRTRDISVGVQLEHWPTSPANMQGTGNSYGISVQVPLFTRYYFDGEIRAAEAAIDSARETLEKTRAAARMDVAAAHEDALATGEKSQRFVNELLAASERTAKAAAFAFANGASSVLDMLDARRTERAIQMDAIAAAADYAKSLAAWQAATAANEQANK